MDLRVQTKEWVAREKHYTALILKNLAVIEQKKLYCDYGHPTLFKYLTKELNYSEAEANVRVGAVKLCGRDRNVAKNVAAGTLSLTNAAQVNTSLNQHEKETGKPASAATVGKAVSLALNTSTRNAKDKLTFELNLKTPRTEKLTLDERMLNKMDRLRKIYGDLSAYELIDILLEEKLKAPLQSLGRPRSGRMPRATSARGAAPKQDAEARIMLRKILATFPRESKAKLTKEFALIAIPAAIYTTITLKNTPTVAPTPRKTSKCSVKTAISASGCGADFNRRVFARPLR